MSLQKPYSKKQIDRAGKTLVSRDVSEEEINQAFAILGGKPKQLREILVL